MNLLLLEPDFLLAKTYKKAFKTAGFKVEITHDAQEAIKKIDYKKPDCLVLELQLEGHSGIEFLHEFRSYEDWNTIPLYIYSNVPIDTFRQSKKLLGSLGVNRYFYKAKTPISQLIGAINSDFKA